MVFSNAEKVKGAFFIGAIVTAVVEGVKYRQASAARRKHKRDEEQARRSRKRAKQREARNSRASRLALSTETTKITAPVTKAQTVPMDSSKIALIGIGVLGLLLAFKR